MPKIERLKEELGWLKASALAFVAIDVSVIAWLAQNYDKAGTLLIGVAVVAIASVTALLAVITRQVYNRLDQLEKL